MPIFKTFTHLPPYMGMLLVLGVIWAVSELIHKHKEIGRASCRERVYGLV